jgi:biopolymer transport protein ExbD
MANDSKNWQARHQGSPQAVQGLSLQEIIDGLRDGVWDTTDEVLGPGEQVWQPIEHHPQLADLAGELEFTPRRHREEATSIDMNALIDVCLVLLIFFILTMNYAVTVQKVVPMPTVKSDGKKARVVTIQDVKKRMIRLEASMDKAGKLAVRIENQSVNVLADDGQSFDADKLRNAIRPYVRGENGKTEIMFDARGISFGTAIAIQDAAKSAGILVIHHLMRQ